MAVSNLVPFLIMFACNILIIRILRKVQKQRPTMMHDLYVHRANSFTIKMTMMIVICMAYFLLAMTPFTTFFIVESYLRPGYKEANNYVALARLDLIWTVCYLIGLTNFCVNFFLYTAMNDRFSKEFLAMTRCQPR
ncbi:hypothetical protein DPMN_159277 [Dreissena polymorpha]|uniref:G-protein coupled receptors family 1 profile domain-containing protein n=1 Tax=Dreissena polymorpha TaxID=45954 RepID=A0A9D4EKR6_DREPO|nr:hypothetical protein DPMN_159277 [Dreissena polymorpha]